MTSRPFQSEIKFSGFCTLVPNLGCPSISFVPVHSAELSLCGSVKLTLSKIHLDVTVNLKYFQWYSHDWNCSIIYSFYDPPKPFICSYDHGLYSRKRNNYSPGISLTTHTDLIMIYFSFVLQVNFSSLNCAISKKKN